MFDPAELRSQFPIFSYQPDLVYLDNAATTQKPAQVIRSISDFYQHENAPIHRGVYGIAANATHKFEETRHRAAAFIGAKKSSCIVFTSGATAAINLVAQGFLADRLAPGDEVVISAMEHHANLIPWQQICQKSKARLRVIPVSETGELDLCIFKKMLSGRTRLVAITHISNVLGTINPVAEIIGTAHQQNIPVLVDGAQSAACYPVDVEALGADFFVFSGHKIFGPTGTGILYGKAEHLETMRPSVFGGGMVKQVSLEETTFAAPPRCFEAGTPNVAGVIGLGSALDFLQQLNQAGRVAHLENLTAIATEKLLEINGLKIIGTARAKSAIFSFVLGNIHPHDVATFLGAENIAVRAGHHCAQPLMDFYGLPGTVRASFSIYNTPEDAARLAGALKDAQRFFG